MFNGDSIELSGEDFLKEIIQGKREPANMAKTISMDLVFASGGKVIFNAYAKKSYLNPLGGVHGGFAATLLDSATGCAVHTLLKAGEIYVTTELNIKMIKAVPVDIKLVAEAEVLSISRQLAVSNGTIKDGEGVIYAYGSATCLVKRN